ncbi:hypothetical protein PSUB009319_14260 [Ralstonia sp. SET104]|nr:hypothetical protein PSUB009319_14260 [Ralstonia sp. SET104]
MPRLHSTSGGSSDTELNELAVTPTNAGVPGAPSERVVTTVTPVANWDRACLKCAASKSGGVALPCADGLRAEGSLSRVCLGMAP